MAIFSARFEKSLFFTFKCDQEIEIAVNTSYFSRVLQHGKIF